MYCIDISEIKTENKKLIGKGNTANCYLLADGSVLKLYRWNYETCYLMTKDIFTYNSYNFTKIKNNTFIGPDKIVYKDDYLMGYTYSYVNGKPLNKIDKNTKIKDIFRNYNQVINDIKDVSNKNFSLFDTNYGNIIYDNHSIHIIDLDNCWFNKNTNTKTILQKNSKEVFVNVLGSLFNKRYIEDMEFKIKDLNIAYNNIDYIKTDSINDFIDCLSYYCRDNNPDIKTVKNKIKVKRDLNGYYHM